MEPGCVTARTGVALDLPRRRVFTSAVINAARYYGHQVVQVHGLNDRYRLCFAWGDGNAEEVEIVDYH